MMHPNQSLDALTSLIILSSVWQFVAFAYIQVVRKVAKLQSKNFSFKSVLLISTINERFSLSCFLVTIFPPIAQLHFQHRSTHATHNSSNRSEKGLTLETSAFKLFTVANLRCQLLIIINHPVILPHRRSTATCPFIHPVIVNYWSYKGDADRLREIQCGQYLTYS